MVKRAALVVIAATMLSSGSAIAGDSSATPPSSPPAAASTKSAAPRPISFTRDVKEAWAQAREDGRRAGREIGDSARSFGRATRDAAVDGWQKLKKAFSS